MNSPKVEVEISNTKGLEPPSTYAAADVVAGTLKQTDYQQDCCVDLYYCNEAEIIRANKQFRGKSASTNVLSFPNICDDELNDLWSLVDEKTFELGSIMMCLPVVQQEAQTFGITIQQRLAHLTVHATLHLLGYTHDTKETASVMEDLESQILVKLNYDDPWMQNE